jgi:ARG and Rhodanese-Phosphatase-superfamily-associated Protein domain
MRSVRLVLVVGIAVSGLAYLVFSSGQRPRNPVVVADAPPSDTTGDLVIGEPIAFENLTIFPVSSKVPKHADRFITLDEGLKAGTVEILERGAVHGGAPAADPFGEPAAANEPGPDPFSAPAAAEANASPEPAAAAEDRPDAPDSESVPNAPNAPAAESNEPVLQIELPGILTGNAVNELMIVNRSDKPLYLMPGEVIIGGSQDRTIGEELVIAPGSEPTAIAVFCVEHGRWGGRNASEYARILSPADHQGVRMAAVDLASSTSVAGFSGNLSLVVEQTQLIEEANAGKFVGSVGSLNKPARLAVQAGEGQAKVWEEVATQNAKADVSSETGTFVRNYSEPESLERLAPYLKQLEGPIGESPNVVGVIVAVNGEIESMDVFESTPLFKKLWPKLLKSYALDAANARPAEGAAQAAEGDAKVATVDDARRFLRDIASAKKEQGDSKGDLERSRGESDDALLFTVHERKTGPGPAAAIGGMGGTRMGGMGGGFFGEAVHSAGYSK